MTATGFFLEYIWLVPLFPLASAALMLLIGRRLKNSAVSVLCVGSVLLSFVFALGAVLQLLAADPEHRVFQKILFEWVPAGPMYTSAGEVVRFVADWGMLLDPLSCVMVLVVTGVGFVIHLYSIGYMGHEGGYYRFFGYMNLFMFSMLMLVLAIEAPAFFQPRQLVSLLCGGAALLIVSCGVALVMICRQIDISVGSQFAICSVLLGLLVKAHWPLPLAALVIIIVGAVLGGFNGVAVAGLGLPSIVVTLATMVTWREALRWWRQGEFVRDLPGSFQWFGLGG